MPEPSPRGRPSSARWPVVVVSCPDGVVAWSDGVFAGHPDLARRAAIIADAHPRVAFNGFHGAVVTADRANPIGAAAAMLHAAGPNAELADPPQLLLDVIDGRFDPVDALLAYDGLLQDGDVADVTFDERDTGCRAPTFSELDADDLEALVALGCLPDGSDLPPSLTKGAP